MKAHAKACVLLTQIINNALKRNPMDSKLLVVIAVVIILGIGGILLISTGPDSMEQLPLEESMPGAMEEESVDDMMPPPPSEPALEEVPAPHEAGQESLEAETEMEMDIQMAE